VKSRPYFFTKVFRIRADKVFIRSAGWLFLQAQDIIGLFLFPDFLLSQNFQNRSKMPKMLVLTPKTDETGQKSPIFNENVFFEVFRCFRFFCMPVFLGTYLFKIFTEGSFNDG